MVKMFVNKLIKPAGKTLNFITLTLLIIISYPMNLGLASHYYYNVPDDVVCTLVWCLIVPWTEEDAAMRIVVISFLLRSRATTANS